MSSANHISRFVRLRKISLLILLTVGHCLMVHSQYSFKLALNDRCLRRDHVFQSFTDHRLSDCFLKCLEHCLCIAFQIVDEIDCELLSTTRLIKPSSLVDSPGCLYYDVIPEDSSTQPCQTGWPCSCHPSNPCLNGGSCEAAISVTPTQRFQCKCPLGYTGNLCQDPSKSCRGYINGTRVPGKYKVFDANMNLFDVFCDFDTNSTMAWTLIQSYELRNKIQFSFAFIQDLPVNESSPVWDSYRLSKSRMESIQQDSSKWRVTCRYDSDGLNYNDYVRASIEKINILTHDGTECEEVEFINIRGYQCENCTALVAHRCGENCPLQVDSYFSKVRKCSFQPMDSFACGSRGEDNFGAYVCVNPSHRCSASPSSTTQTWFGGK